MLARLALVLGGVLMGLLLGELTTRLLGGGKASMSRGMFFAFDSEAGKRCRPNADLRFVHPGSFNVRVRCNSEGLRDREHPFSKSPGTHRILCLGDSFAWGYGVENEEMFSTRLEHKFRGAVETINFGVAGYNTVQELVRLETDGLAYSPDWTVVLFCDNDLEGNFDSKESMRPVAELRGDNVLYIANRPVSKPWFEPVTRWLHGHSRLVVEMYYCAQLLRERMKERRTAERIDCLAQRRLSTSHTATEYPPISIGGMPNHEDFDFSLVDRFVEPDYRMDQAWTTLKRIYKAMYECISGHGGRMLVAYVPDPILAMSTHFEAALAQSGIAPEQACWDRPEMRLEKICSDLNIPFVNLIQAFRAVDKPEKLFLKNNGHWSAAGHELAAKIIADRLIQVDSSLNQSR